MNNHMGLIARKPVLGVSVKASFKPVSSATETSEKIEILPVARLNMVLFKKRITKALIRLCCSQTPEDLTKDQLHLTQIWAKMKTLA